MTKDRACANRAPLPRTYVDTPGMKYSFVREEDADLETIEGRIQFFCEQMDVEAPQLEYDAEDPGEIMLTDEFCSWFSKTGASLDWIISGKLGPMMVTSARANKENERSLKVLRRFDDTEQKMLLVALRASTEENADIEQVMETFKEAVEEHRAA